MRLYLRSRLQTLLKETRQLLGSRIRVALLCYIIITIAATSENTLIVLLVILIAALLRRKYLIVILASVAISTLLTLKFNTEYPFEARSNFGREVEIIGNIVEKENKEFNQEIIIKTDIVNGLILAKLDKYPKVNLNSRVELKGKLVEPKYIKDFDYPSYLKSRKIYYLLEGKASLIENTLEPRTNILNQLENLIGRSFEYTSASLLEGILYGSKSNFSEEFEEDLRNSGLFHIVSVSGFNFVIIYSLIIALLTSFINRRVVQLISIPLLIFYLYIVGTENIPALRATLMLLLIVVSSLIGRRVPIANLLLITISVLLLEYPLYWTNLSFLLSFAALVGLITFTPRIKQILSKRFSSIPENFHEIVSSTLAVMITTSLISLIFFESFSVVSLISNLITLPAVPFLMGFGAVFIFTSALGIEPFAVIASSVLKILLSYLKVIVEIFGQIDSKSTTSIAIGVLVLSILLLILLTNDYKKFKAKHSQIH